MKRLTTVLFVLFFISIFWSCEKNEITEQDDSIKISLKNTDVYKHDFNISGDEEGATIKVQANHFSISEIIRNESTNWGVVYYYKAEPGFVGEDFVEIETNTGSNGASAGNMETVKLLFEIID